MKTLAIFSPNKNAYSETFIQAHKGLPFHVKYYHDGFFPAFLEGKGTIVSYSRINRVRNRLNKKINIAEQGLIDSLKNERVDCVLAEYGPTACLTLNAVKYLNLPLIVHFFGFDATMKTIVEQYREDYKLVFAYAKYIVVVSEKMRLDLIRLGCPAQKIVLTYCGPDNSFLKTNPHFKLPQFLSVGRFVDKKAPYLTIAAFKDAVYKFPEAKLIMIGDGILLNACKNLSRFWRIEKSVEFIGIKKPTEIFKIFEDSLAFVQHSIIAEDGDSEGTPVAILDAQAAGLPVISTFHGGIPDVIINNETGLLVEEHDVDGMSKNMLRVLEEKGLAHRLGIAGKKRTNELFTKERHLEILGNLIENACKTKS